MKFERQHADFDYNRLVVISDLRLQRDVDAQLALLAANPTSATAIALSASYVSFGTDLATFVAGLPSGALYTYTLLTPDGDFADLYTGKKA